VEALFAAMESTAIAEYLRVSRWGYATVSALHIFGFGLLLGAILPFNLHGLGLWRNVPRVFLAQVLLPVAAIGLALAILTGTLLFSVDAWGYSELPVLQIKVLLVGVATLSALLLHRAAGLSLQQIPDTRLRIQAAFSTACWLGALVLGRLIAFVE
jgi:hypothetical protein